MPEKYSLYDAYCDIKQLKASICMLEAYVDDRNTPGCWDSQDAIDLLIDYVGGLSQLATTVAASTLNAYNELCAETKRGGENNDQ